MTPLAQSMLPPPPPPIAQPVPALPVPRSSPQTDPQFDNLPRLDDGSTDPEDSESEYGSGDESDDGSDEFDDLGRSLSIFIPLAAPAVTHTSPVSLQAPSLPQSLPPT